uniref:Putative secreted protein n=1 Tax=Ixodes ricinus TaxID=34613 RepID=A0A6B0UM81_IXORI
MRGWFMMLIHGFFSRRITTAPTVIKYKTSLNSRLRGNFHGPAHLRLQSWGSYIRYAGFIFKMKMNTLPVLLCHHNYSFHFSSWVGPQSHRVIVLHIFRYLASGKLVSPKYMCLHP